MKEKSFYNHFEKNITPESSGIKAKELFKFKKEDMNGSWLILENEKKEKLEGSLYYPNKEKMNNEVIIFHPGIPGDGVAWFEEKHVGSLVNEGYEVFVARHRGLKYDKENSTLINNEERLIYKDLDTNTNPDWLSEPEESIKYFATKDNVKSITLITHSFSGLSAAKSLVEIQKDFENKSNNPLNKLNKWLSLSGMTLNIEEDGVLDKPPIGNITLDFYKKILQSNYNQIYHIDNPDKMITDLKEAELNMRNSLKDIPQNIGVIGVYPEKDSFITIKAGDDLQKNLKRGLVINDQTFREDKFLSEDAHDFPHLLPETILRLINMKVSKYQHSVTVNDSGKS